MEHYFLDYFLLKPCSITITTDGWTKRNWLQFIYLFVSMTHKAVSFIKIFNDFCCHIYARFFLKTMKISIFMLCLGNLGYQGLIRWLGGKQANR